MTPEDFLFMTRAFELGERGRLYAAPNPHVGCVIAARGEVWGEGWHHRAGERHAEVHALARVRADRRERLAEATAYVTLEPCAHVGRTPPCADALLDAGIGRVVAAVRDPSPWVAGAGFARLDTGGVRTQWADGQTAELAHLFNRRFFTHGRPWVVLKWAETADGFLGPGGAKTQHVITSSWAQRLTHRWRAEEQGILVGYRTWMTDEPRLDVRKAPGRSPVRIVLAPRHRRSAAADVWWVTAPELVEGPRDLAWRVEDGLEALLRAIRAEAGVHSLLVEGGGATLQSFVDAGCWDECKWWVADAALGAPGIPAPRGAECPAVWREQGRGPAETWHRFIRPLPH